VHVCISTESAVILQQMIATIHIW